MDRRRVTAVQEIMIRTMVDWSFEAEVRRDPYLASEIRTVSTSTSVSGEPGTGRR